MLKKPVEIHIYDDNGEVKKSFKLCIIPWKFMKKAGSMFAKIDNANEEETLNAMTDFLCEVFNNQFDNEELDSYGDAFEIMQAINQIMEEVGQINPNVLAGKK